MPRNVFWGLILVSGVAICSQPDLNETEETGQRPAFNAYEGQTQLIDAQNEQTGQRDAEQKVGDEVGKREGLVDALQDDGGDEQDDADDGVDGELNGGGGVDNHNHSHNTRNTQREGHRKRLLLAVAHCQSACKRKA